MVTVNEIVEQVENLLSDEISLDEFEDWSAEHSWNIHSQADTKARDLAYLIRALLNDYANNDALRQELADSIRPFADMLAQKSVVPSAPIRAYLRANSQKVVARARVGTTASSAWLTTRTTPGLVVSVPPRDFAIA